MKITFYIAVAICLIQSCFWLLFPFMGPATILDFIKDGLFGTKDNVGLSATFKFFSSAVTFLYFLSIFSCSILPLFYKLQANRKYKISILLAALSILILFAAKLINTYFL